MAPKPNVYVSSALDTISSQSITNGCLAHNIQVNLNIKLIVCNLKFIIYFKIRDGLLKNFCREV
jgi:hypothetical protein